MDDPEVAFPVFERAQKLGLKVVAIHKAVPLGPVPMDTYRVDDIDRAAIAFPGLNFEIVHGGMAFLEETAWQLARFSNVFVNLEVTSAYVAIRPKVFDRALSTLMSIGGAAMLNRLVWGTGAIAFHPQPLLESFVRRFELSTETLECTGTAQLTAGDKRKILFDNFAAMSGIDVSAMLAATAHDEFALVGAAALQRPFSTLRLARA
jgi:predicted TIM-barrel fold metal-dependent hydrolase